MSLYELERPRRSPDFKSNKQEAYKRYARGCLKLADLISDRQSRTLLREMAAEWLKLIDEMEG